MAVVAGFSGPAYSPLSSNTAFQECINWMPELSDYPTAKTPITLVNTPGASARFTLPTYPNKALFEVNGRAFAVNGAVFYEFFTTNTFTAWGMVAQDNNPATLCSSGDGGHEVFITAGNNGYIFDTIANTLTLVLTGCQQGAFLDGYFLALDATTSTLKCSALFDGTDWTGTGAGGGGSAQRNTAADRWQGMFVIHRNIWLLGSQTTEVWEDKGTFPFPMGPIQGAFMQQGLAAQFAGARLDESLVWLGHNEQGTRAVYRSSGFEAQTISTQALATELQTYTTVDDADVFSYQQNGHTFYVLNLPDAEVSWTFDLVNGLWHKRAYWNTGTGAYEAARPSHHTHAFDVSYVGDRVTGVISRLGTDIYTESDGSHIRRLRQAPTINEELRVINFSGGAQLDCQVGVGDLTTTDPQIVLQWSDDQGQTWSTELPRSLGASGAAQTRVRWLRLGQSRSRIWRIIATDPVPYWVQQFYLINPQVGTS